MTVISALGSNGRSILPGLQGASPARGLVASESVPRTRLVPGHLVRHHGGWAVITDIRHDGIHGITTAGLLGALAHPAPDHACMGPSQPRSAPTPEIDPARLHKLIRYATRKLCDDCYQAASPACWLNARTTATCHSTMPGLCHPHRETDERCDRCGRTGGRLTAHEPQDDDGGRRVPARHRHRPAAASPAGPARSRPRRRGVYFLNPATWPPRWPSCPCRVPGAERRRGRRQAAAPAEPQHGPLLLLHRQPVRVRRDGPGRRRMMLATEADVIRTLRAGTYTLPRLYELCEQRTAVDRDGGQDPVPGHAGDVRWKHRVRGALAALNRAGRAGPDRPRHVGDPGHARAAGPAAADRGRGDPGRDRPAPEISDRAARPA